MKLNLNSQSSMVLGTLLSALATLVIAGLTCLQVYLMKDTLQVAKESMRVNRMPVLTMLLSDPSLDSNVVVGFKSEEGGIRWNLAYYVRNDGSYPAYDLAYFHTLSTDSTLVLPAEQKYSDRWARLIIGPSEWLNLGYDVAYHQEFMDEANAGKLHYRYLFLRYKDEFGNQYRYMQRWRMERVKDVEAMQFVPVEYRRLSPSN